MWINRVFRDEEGGGDPDWHHKSYDPLVIEDNTAHSYVFSGLSKPASLDQVGQCCCDHLAGNGQMRGDELGDTGIVAAKAVDLGVGHGHDRPLEEFSRV